MLEDKGVIGKWKGLEGGRCQPAIYTSVRKCIFPSESFAKQAPTRTYDVRVHLWQIVKLQNEPGTANMEMKVMATVDDCWLGQSTLSGTQRRKSLI